MKKYDPLWELVGEKVALRGAEEDVDARCPECHVILHVAPDLASGDTVECGLCGAALSLVREAEGVGVKPRG